MRIRPRMSNSEDYKSNRSDVTNNIPKSQLNIKWDMKRPVSPNPRIISQHSHESHDSTTSFNSNTSGSHEDYANSVASFGEVSTCSSREAQPFGHSSTSLSTRKSPDLRHQSQRPSSLSSMSSPTKTAAFICGNNDVDIHVSNEPNSREPIRLDVESSPEVGTNRKTMWRRALQKLKKRDKTVKSQSLPEKPNPPDGCSEEVDVLYQFFSCRECCTGKKCQDPNCPGQNPDRLPSVKERDLVAQHRRQLQKKKSVSEQAKFVADENF